MNRWIVFIANSAKCFFDSGFMKSNGVILDQMVAYLDTTHSVVAWAFSIQFEMSLMSGMFGIFLAFVAEQTDSHVTRFV